MVKKFCSFRVSFVSQTLRLFLQLSGKLGNLGSQWKCWPNLRQTALCRPYPSAISGSLCCEEWVSPRFYMEDCLHTNWISCCFFLLLASGSDSVQGSGSLIHTQSYAQVGHFFLKASLNHSTRNDCSSLSCWVIKKILTYMSKECFKIQSDSNLPNKCKMHF